MNAPQKDLDKLSIPDLESLLAEKRRRESKRMLRSIAGRAPADGAPPPPTLRPSGLSGSSPPPRKGKTTARLNPDEARVALRSTTSLGTQSLGDPAPGSAIRRFPVAPVPTDRFRRSGLASIPRPRPVRGPAWLRKAPVRRGIDLGLQLAEIAFVLLFIYVIAEWLFADSQTTTDLSAALAPGEPLAAPVADAAGPVAPRIAGMTSPREAPPAPVPAGEIRDAHPAIQVGLAAPGAATLVPALGAETRDDILRDRRILAHAPVAQTPLSQTITATTAALATPGRATATAPARPPTPPPTATAPPVAAVETNPAWATGIHIPRIKLDVRVREVEVRFDTWEWEVADFMAGHHTSTANPGEQGNVVIAGHRDIRGSVFMNLDKLQKGDDVFLTTGRGVFHYVVRTTLIVKPDEVRVMAPTSDHRLTLITCTPVKIASHRLVVIADLDAKYVGPEPPRQ